MFSSFSGWGKKLHPSRQKRRRRRRNRIEGGFVCKSTCGFFFHQHNFRLNNRFSLAIPFLLRKVCKVFLFFLNKVKHVATQSAKRGKTSDSEKLIEIPAPSHCLTGRGGGWRAWGGASAKGAAAETNTVFFALLIINYPSPCICVYS